MTTTAQKELRRALADAYAFVRSQEANLAIQSVTLAQLFQEEIDRNGDSDRSNAAQYNPYSFDPQATAPASRASAARANYLSGTDTNNPTKLDRVLALKNSIQDIVAQVKNTPLEEPGQSLDDNGELMDLLTDDPLIIGTDAILEDIA